MAGAKPPSQIATTAGGQVTRQLRLVQPTRIHVREDDVSSPKDLVRTLHMIQTAQDAATLPVRAFPLLGGNWFTGVVVTAGTTLNVVHNLKRAWLGVVITKASFSTAPRWFNPSQAASLDPQQMPIQFDQTGTVDLYIF